MNVSIDGVRLNVARAFNGLVDDLKNENQIHDKLEDLRMHIAFLLLTHDCSIGMSELDPDKYLQEVPTRNCFQDHEDN